ncbi:MAG: hypothetical protein IKM22_00380 [Clostridia bacterium]|nr:hypothetical protein [Clostridia bacterium]
MLMEHKPNKNAPSNNNNNDEGEAGDGEGEAGDGEGGDEGGEGDNEDNGDGDGNGNSKAKGKSKENGDSNADGSDIEGKGKENSKSKKKKEITKKDLKSLVASIKQDISKNKEKYGELKESDEKEENKEFSFDDHSFWRGDDEIQSLRQTWEVRIMNTVESLFSSEGGNGRGTVPKAAERIIAELKNPVIDWRTVLNDFVQEEITDYSFAPPDKRMEDCPFFLPDFNEKDENVKDILFMVDTSGSMSDIAITECYSEIYGAIQQFNGKLQGKLGFFDAVVVEPIAFEDEEEFKIIRPKGGGGTSFDIIFQYVNEQMQDEPPVSIVILTDGYAPFPNEEDANGIPVLWIINNENATPPWGKVARLLTK